MRPVLRLVRPLLAVGLIAAALPVVASPAAVVRAQASCIDHIVATDAELLAAIADANGCDGSQTITIRSGTYDVGLIEVTDDVIIQGADPDDRPTLVYDGAPRGAFGAGQIFVRDSTNGSVRGKTFTFRHLQFVQGRNGRSQMMRIWNNDLALENVSIQGTSPEADGGLGYAVGVINGNARLIDVTIDDVRGAGVSIRGSLTAIGLEVSDTGFSGIQVRGHADGSDPLVDINTSSVNRVGLANQFAHGIDITGLASGAIRNTTVRSGPQSGMFISGAEMTLVNVAVGGTEPGDGFPDNGLSGGSPGSRAAVFSSSFVGNGRGIDAIGVLDLDDVLVSENREGIRLSGGGASDWRAVVAIANTTADCVLESGASFKDLGSNVDSDDTCGFVDSGGGGSTGGTTTGGTTGGTGGTSGGTGGTSGGTGGTTGGNGGTSGGTSTGGTSTGGTGSTTGGVSTGGTDGTTDGTTSGGTTSGGGTTGGDTTGGTSGGDSTGGTTGGNTTGGSTSGGNTTGGNTTGGTSTGGTTSGGDTTGGDSGGSSTGGDTPVTLGDEYEPPDDTGPESEAVTDDTVSWLSQLRTWLERELDDAARAANEAGTEVIETIQGVVERIDELWTDVNRQVTVDWNRACAWIQEQLDVEVCAALGGERFGPRAVADRFTIQQGTTARFDIETNDVDDALRPFFVVPAELPSDGDDLPHLETVSIGADGIITVVASPGQTGTTSMTYDSCTADGHCTTGAIIVDVVADPVPPEPSADVLTLPHGGTRTADVLGNDRPASAGGPLVLESIGAAMLDGAPTSEIVATIGSGGVEVRQLVDDVASDLDRNGGTVVITYTACAAPGVCADSTLTVHVQGTEGVVANSDSVWIGSRRTATIDVLHDDSIGGAGIVTRVTPVGRAASSLDGDAVVNDDQTVTIEVGPAPDRRFQLEYEVCRATPAGAPDPTACAVATIDVEVVQRVGPIANDDRFTVMPSAFATRDGGDTNGMLLLDVIGSATGPDTSDVTPITIVDPDVREDGDGPSVRSVSYVRGDGQPGQALVTGNLIEDGVPGLVVELSVPAPTADRDVLPAPGSTIEFSYEICDQPADGASPLCDRADVVIDIAPELPIPMTSEVLRIPLFDVSPDGVDADPTNPAHWQAPSLIELFPNFARPGGELFGDLAAFELDFDVRTDPVTLQRGAAEKDSEGLFGLFEPASTDPLLPGDVADIGYVFRDEAQEGAGSIELDFREIELFAPPAIEWIDEPGTPTIGLARVWNTSVPAEVGSVAVTGIAVDDDTTTVPTTIGGFPLVVDVEENSVQVTVADGEFLIIAMALRLCS
ncbi:MAG: hypothetical protein AAGG08_05845, partial [Actinomycetota bacterium]